MEHPYDCLQEVDNYNFCEVIENLPTKNESISPPDFKKIKNLILFLLNKKYYSINRII